MNYNEAYALLESGTSVRLKGKPGFFTIHNGKFIYWNRKSYFLSDMESDEREHYLSEEDEQSNNWVEHADMLQ